MEEESVFLSGVYESLWIKVTIDKNTCKIIGNIYRPNSASKANLSLAIATHISIISKIKANKKYKNCSIEIASDFNIDLLKFQEHAQTNEYLDTLLSFGLLPIVTKPTRISPSTSTLIDHIFVGNHSKLHNFGIILTYLSDHYPVFYIEQTRLPKPRPKPFQTRKITSETQSSLNTLLKNTSFKNIIDQNDPLLAFSEFFNFCNSATEVSFPEITVYPNKSRLCHAPWMSPGLIISSQTKQKFFNKNLNLQLLAIHLDSRITTIFLICVNVKPRKCTTKNLF